jgi:hypothetical protein
MNLLQVESYFREACLKYANDYSPGFDVDRLWVGHYIPNPDKKTDADPNSRTVITAWNHSSPQPTIEQLMKYTVQEVTNDYDSLMTPLPDELSDAKVSKWVEPQKQRVPKRKLNEGDMIYNKTKRLPEVFTNDDWAQVVYCNRR